MSIIKKCFISGLIGFIIAGVLGVATWKYYPQIKIIYETPTVTTIIKVPKDYQECLDCLNSKGEISEIMDSENVMTIFYEDACKKAEKKVTLKSENKQRKNFMIFSVSDSISKDSFKTYGLGISYYNMMFDRVGVGGGMMANLNSITLHCGAVINW